MEVASFILKHGYNCQVDRIPGTTMPMLTALGEGDIDVMMEVWKQNLQDAWKKYEDRGDVIDIGTNFPDAIQGFFVPTYMIEGDEKRAIDPTAPDLKHVQDLKRYKDLFRDPEVPSKGRFYNCVLGWSCEDVNTKKLKAYGLDNYFVNFKPGTGAALASVIASKYERGEPFVAYYWGPTWVLGKYDLTMLEEPDFDSEIWKRLVLGNSPNQAVEYPVVKVKIGVNSKWAKRNPVALSFLKKYRTKSKHINEALAFMQQKQSRTLKDAALHFLNTRQNVWKKWVPSDVKLKVLKAVDEQESTEEVWKWDLGKSVNKKVKWLVGNYGNFFRKVSKPLLKLILIIEKVLFTIPWWVLTIILSVLAFFSQKKRLSLLVLFCLTIIQALGLWSLSMQTLSLMIISTLVSTFLGLPIGIVSAKNNKFRTILLPILDAMQTMPSFVYLIPALMLFGLGKVPAVFATVIYAIVPIIRLTDLGIRGVDNNIKEAATSFGTNRTQILLKVELPLALPTIMAGINQTTMMALSMVVIASMIGARGLGEQVLLGIQKLDVGQGFVAGMAIVLLAIVLDRITQGYGKKWDNTL